MSPNLIKQFVPKIRAFSFGDAMLKVAGFVFFVDTLYGQTTSQDHRNIPHEIPLTTTGVVRIFTKAIKLCWSSRFAVRRRRTSLKPISCVHTVQFTNEIDFSRKHCRSCLLQHVQRNRSTSMTDGYPRIHVYVLLSGTIPPIGTITLWLNLPPRKHLVSGLGLRLELIRVMARWWLSLPLGGGGSCT